MSRLDDWLKATEADYQDDLHGDVLRLIKALRLTLYYVESDNTWEALEEQVFRILTNGDFDEA